MIMPHRIFLDTGVVQYLLRYGEAVFENAALPSDNRLNEIPSGLADVEALRRFCFVNQRNAFELVVSDNSVKEVLAAGEPKFASWLMELMNYWYTIQASYEGSVVNGAGASKRARLTAREFGYLSNKDRALVADACEMECDTFLTVDRRLARNAEHLRREVGMSIVTPTSLWDLLEPWAGLLP